MMYKNGQGVLRDKNKAKFWIEKSAAQGNEAATNEIKSLSIGLFSRIKNKFSF